MSAFLSSLFHRLCVLAVFSLSAVLHGASPGFPFVEDFQAEIFIDEFRTTARWTNEGVTLKHARNAHKNRFTMQEKSAGALGTDAVEDIALHDINSDGHLDLIAAGAGGIAVYFMDPSSEALFAGSTMVTTVPRSSMTFGDYDGDGDLDIVAGSAEGDVSVMLYKNTGGGAFAAGVSIDPMFDLLVHALATADFNNDGHLDIVLALSDENGDLDIYGGDGDGAGNFTYRSTVISASVHRDMKVGDMDGDGYVDIVVAKRGSLDEDSSILHRNLMAWDFDDADLPDRLGDSLALGDINNDGHLDIVMGVNGSRNRLYLNNGRGSFSTSTQIGRRHTTSDMAIGDMDGDGDLDIFEGVLGERRGQSFVYSNQGGGVFRTSGSNLPAADTRAAALGDVDGDGDLDIALGHRNDTLKVKINPGGSTATTPVAGLFDTAPVRVVSSQVNAGNVAVPSRVHLKAVEEKPANTEIVYYLSNDGGNRWHQVQSPGRVDFAGEGSDLRWGARLTSLSPTTSPRILQVDVEAGLQVYVDSTPHKSGQVWLAANVEVGKPPLQASLLLRNRGKNALDITGVELDSAIEGFSLPDHRPTASSPHTILSEGKLDNLWIRFKPSRRGRHETELTISSRENGNDLPDFMLTLEGRGHAPLINIGRITVPPTRTGREGHFTIGLRNTGERFLVVTATRISDVMPPLPAEGPPAAGPLFRPASPWQTETFPEGGMFQRFPFVFKPHHHGLSSATLTFSSNAFNEDENEVILSGRGLAPVIAVDVDSAFGEVDVNTETTRVAVIRNTGDWPLKVINIRFGAAPAGGFDFSPEETSFVVSQTRTRELVLSFLPVEAGEAGNRLLIISDAHNARSSDNAFVVEVSGEGVAPHIGVMVDGVPVGERRIHSFGKQRLNTDKPVIVGIDNTTGTALLRVDPIARSSSEHLPFSWTGSSAVEVVRGGSATSVLTVLFKPTERGFHSTTLAITSNALNSTRYEITLTGTGTAPLMEVLLGDALQPSGSTWSFGWVSPGAVATQEMTIRNTGDATLRIMAHPSFDNADFTAGNPDGYRYPHPVEAQSSASYVLLFKPPLSSPAGEVTATMTVISDDFLQTTYTLVLSGIVDLEPVFEAASVSAQNYGAGFPIVPLILPKAKDGNGALTYRLTPATLPAGLSFAAATRTLSGTPTEIAAAITYTWTATDADGDTAALEFTIAVQAGICNRTREVRDAIVEWVSGVTGCADITATHLEEVDVLYLDNQGITVLKRGDFAGLTSLTELDLSSNLLESLDAKLFAGLDDLMELNLRSNRLAALDAKLFAGLAGLERLNLRSNRLASLDARLFAGLGSLERLDLYANRLSRLPEGIFDGLDVERLYLNRNPASPFVLNVYPVLSGDGVRAQIDEGAPREIQVMWSATGGSSGTGVATIPAGARFSPVFGAMGQQATTITLTNPVFSSTRYLNGLQLAVPATASDVRVPSAPIMEVMLGDVVQPHGSTHSFGQLSPGGIVTQAMTIHNLGETTLQIKTSPTASGAFRVGNPNGYEYPHPVEAMSSASYVVSFEPPLSSPAGEMTATMTIISNDFLQTTYTVGLSGEVVIGTRPVFSGSPVAAQNYIAGEQITPLILPEATSGDGTLTYKLAPELPPGLSFATATRVLSGTPTTDATATTYSWKATDADGDTATLNFTITVRSGICSRTQQVRNGIVGWTAGLTSCAYITAAHLGRIRGLYLWNKNISTLKRGDFAGLSNLYVLTLSGNHLRKLDKSLFSGLRNLSTLLLSGNSLTNLDKSLFSGLSNLKWLDLSNNQLSQLPEGLFDGLNVTNELRLHGNPGSPFVLDVYPELSDGVVRARVDEGAPREIRVDWAASGGLNTTGVAIIAGGARASTNRVVTAGRQAITVTLENPRLHGVNVYDDYDNSRGHSNNLFLGFRLFAPATRSSIRIPGTDPIAEVVLGGTPQPLGSTHSFGQSAPGGVVTQVMTVHNSGDVTLQIREEPSLGGAFQISNPNGYQHPHSVEAMSSASYVVSFEPPLSSVPGGLTATMTVINNDPLQTTYTVVLHGDVFIDLQPVFEGPSVTTQNYEVGMQILPLTLPEATSGDMPITYTLTPQTLPPGLSFATATRVLSGTPTAVAMATTYTWKATDADGDTVTLNFMITVWPGICNRTQQVRDEIVELTAGITNCANITATHLAGIRELNLRGKNISALKRGDFAGLDSLSELNLGNNRLAELDGLLFSGLSNLSELNLGNNRLAELDGLLFSGLSNLHRLDLRSNRLTNPKNSLFSGLSNLSILLLHSNRLTNLDNSLFSGLSNLEWLSLSYNQLTELDNSLFFGLSNLTSLYLDNNQLSQLPEGLFDGLNLTYILQLDGNPGSSFVLDVYPELSDGGVRLRIDEGAPSEMRVNWWASGGLSGIGSATIAGGSRVSNRFVMAGRQAITVTLGNPRLHGVNFYQNYASYRSHRSNSYHGFRLSLPATATSIRVPGTDPIAEVVLGDTPQPPDSIHSFGWFVPGSVVTQVMTVRNLGDVTLQIEEEPGLGGAFRISNPNGYQYPHPVEAMSSASYVVSFEPSLSSASGGLMTTMTVINNDPLQSTYTVVLHGEVFVGTRPVFNGPSVATQNYIVGEQITPLTLPEATSGDGTLAYQLTPELSPGLSFSTATRVLSGTPTTNATAAAYTTVAYTWKATDADGDAATLNFTITVWSGICNRTQQVRDEIVRQTAGVTSCADITAAHLGRIRSLWLSLRKISALKPGDFAGLSSLVDLSLGSNYLTNLDKSLFAGLGSLRTLYLGGNDLTDLDKSLFAGLNNLWSLSLGNNRLTSLDQSLFAGLNNLWFLRLDNNRLTSLNQSLFADLNNLAYLHLDNNQLSQLPEGLFDGLNLTDRLLLEQNPGSPFVLDVYPELSDGVVRARIDEGAPREIRVNWTASGGLNTTGVAIIAAGERVGTIVTATAGRQAITVTLDNPKLVAGDFSGRGFRLSVPATMSSVRISGTDPIAEVVLGDTPQPLGSTHSFGQLSPGRIATQAMTVHNIGDVTLQIRQEPTLGGAFRISNPNGYQYPHAVEAMSSASYVVSFEPPRSSVSGDLTVTMTVINNDPLQSTYTVALHGEVVDLHPAFDSPSVAAQNYEVGVQIPPLTLPGAANGNGVLTYTLTPALPPGLSFNAATRALSGTPTAAVSAAAYALTATDADGDTATLNFTITVRTGICNRTERVRDKIMRLIPGVTNCSDITATHLSGINQLELSWHPFGPPKTGDFAGLTNLDYLGLKNIGLTSIDSNLFAGLTNLTRLPLAFNNLTSLEPDTFAGLSNLVHLRLANNRLSALPPGIFDGLNLTTSLFLEGNPGAPFTLNIYPELSANSVRARIDEAAPREIQVSWTATGGSNETGAATIPAGSRFSPVFGTAGQQAITITLSNPRFSNAGNLRGIQLAVPTAASSVTLPALPPTPQSSPPLEMSDPSRFPAPPPSPPQPSPPLKMSGG